MGRVTTNNTQLAYAAEVPANPGFLPGDARPSGGGNFPGSPEWTLLEPNDITDIGATITTTPRDPISPTRQRRKGAVTDLDSAMGFDHDATYGLMEDFIPPFVFANRTNDDLNVRPDSVADDGFVVTGYPVSARAASKTLYIAEGFSVSANNGLHVASAVAANKITITGFTAANEEAANAVPKGARLRFAGKRVDANAANRATVDADGNGNITTVAAAPNWTMAGLTNGQVIGIFKDKDNYIWGRVRGTSATTITLDKATVTGEIANGDAFDVLYGGFVRNVAVSDTTNYLERSFTIEAVWDNLGNNPNTGLPDGTDEYEYAEGNYCNTFAINLAGQSLATASVGFIGTDTEPPTRTRKTGADDPFPAPRTNALNTTSDIARLRILEDDLDPQGLTTDFDSLTVTLNNNVSPEKVIGSLAARYINFGNFEVDIEGDVIFSNSGVVSAVRSNATVTMDWILRNRQTVGAAAVAFDIPAMTLGLGGRNLPRDESVTLSTTAQAFGDPVLGYSLGVSFIPYIPE